MKKFITLILFLFFVGINQCYAAKFNFLVIPTDLFVDGQKNYLVYPQSATLIGNDIINYYNQHPDMSAVQINQLKTYLEKPENYRFKKDVQVFLTNYKENFVIDFNIVQKLAALFKVKQVLLIGCNMDAQNYITRRTMWDFLDVPGATVVDPAYRLSTQATLIDANNQIVLWQHNYQKLISSRENRMIPTTFEDSNEQLEKVKKYSTKFLAPQVVQETQLALRNISPYQNLNVTHPEVVKPNYVSIDKVKIDAKRGMVKSGRAVKRGSAAAGASIASGFVKLARKTSSKINNLCGEKKSYNVNKINRSKRNSLTIDEQIEQMKQKEQEKLELKKAKQMVKYEKQLQKQQLNAARKEAQQEAKKQLQQQKLELQRKLQPQVEVEPEPVVEVNTKSVDIKVQETVVPAKDVKTVEQTDNSQAIEKKSKSLIEKIRAAKKQGNKEVEPAEVQIEPEPTVIQKDIKPTPFIRTKTYRREMDYTINDY